MEPLRLEIDVADRENDCVAVLEQQQVSRDFRCGLRNLGWLVFDAYLFRLRRIYLVRGVGSVWGALIIAGVVPFLTFFMLCTKDQMAIQTNSLFSSKIDAARFITNLNQMIHGFVAGNLIVGSVMALATTLVLWGVGVKGAVARWVRYSETALERAIPYLRPRGKKSLQGTSP